MEWLNSNSGALNAVAGFLTLLVWLFYAQLLYLNFARQRRPRLLINRGRSKDIHALCLISNMSSESIYISHIIAVLHTSEGDFAQDLIEYEQPSDTGQGASLSEATRQGPLDSGSYSHVGTFSHIIQRVANANSIKLDGYRGTGDTQLQSLEIRLVAIYGSEDKPVGAYRVFNFADNEGDDVNLAPDSFDTQRLPKLGRGRRIRQWVRDAHMI
ncbi:hypothetical protein GCM10027040_20060 [Halomonas shantousis]